MEYFLFGLAICLYGHKEIYPSKDENNMNTKNLAAIAIVIAASAIGLYAVFGFSQPQNQRLIVSTTTSLYETGLLDVLKTELSPTLIC